MPHDSFVGPQNKPHTWTVFINIELLRGLNISAIIMQLLWLEITLLLLLIGLQYSRLIIIDHVNFHIRTMQ